MKVLLPILVNTKETLEKMEMGLFVDTSEYNEILTPFYNILALTSSIEWDEKDSAYLKQYTSVHIGGTSFTCPLPLKETEKIVDEAIMLNNVK